MAMGVSQESPDPGIRIFLGGMSSYLLEYSHSTSPQNAIFFS